MRKIVAGLFMSLDGVVESPDKWGFQYFNDEMTEGINEGIAQADAVLIGRRTYLEFRRDVAPPGFRRTHVRLLEQLTQVRGVDQPGTSSTGAPRL